MFLDTQTMGVKGNNCTKKEIFYKNRLVDCHRLNTEKKVYENIRKPRKKIIYWYHVTSFSL